MKDRRGFLKLLGIGAGAAAAGVLAIVAGTPPTPPRTIQDIEAPKPYIGPDRVPGGDYIKERPPVVPDHVGPLAELTPEQHQWIVDGEKVVTFTPAPPPFVVGKGDIDLSEIDWDTPGNLICVEPPRTVTEVVHTRGTYDHNLGGYSLSNTWEADAISDEFGL